MPGPAVVTVTVDVTASTCDEECLADIGIFPLRPGALCVALGHLPCVFAIVFLFLTIVFAGFGVSILENLWFGWPLGVWFLILTLMVIYRWAYEYGVEEERKLRSSKTFGIEIERLWKRTVNRD